MGCLIQGLLVYVFVAFSSSQMSWVVNIYGVTSFIPMFYTLLVTTGVIRYGFVLRVTQGHWYMWRTPLLAPVSTVGKTRLLVVMVQGAPPKDYSLTRHKTLRKKNVILTLPGVGKHISTSRWPSTSSQLTRVQRSGMI
jgi:hypothetical protein